MAKNIIETVRVNISGLKETGTFVTDDDPSVICVECEAENPYSGSCPKCGCYTPNYVANGYGKVRRIHDISIGRNPIDLYFKGRRYLCKDCGSTFSEPIDFAKSGCWMTNRLIETIREEASIHNFTTVAKKYGVSITWVQKLFMEQVEEIDQTRKLKAPEVLGLDEVHIYHKMRLVVTDSENGVLIDMRHNNSKITVRKAIESLEGYENIKYVTIDMANGYRNVVQECCPKAMIIIDRFHVVRYISKASQTAKKQIVGDLKASIDSLPVSPEKKRKIELLKALGDDPYLFKFGNKRVKQNEKRYTLLFELCEEFPELYTLYKVKMLAERIYDESDSVEEAVENFQQFVDAIPKRGVAYKEFRDFAKMFERWREEILNYFISGKTYTNAATEGLNSQIKVINNNGKGYSFPVLRGKCLVNLSKKAKDRTVKSRKKYNGD